MTKLHFFLTLLERAFIFRARAYSFGVSRRTEGRTASTRLGATVWSFTSNVAAAAQL